jgi:hypothetical protein
MTAIAILPERPGAPANGFRAVAGNRQALGKTAGEALDALAVQLEESESGTIIVIQYLRPDQFFSASQRQRLQELMQRRQTARDGNSSLSSADQAELKALVEEEVRAAGRRAESLVRELRP